MKKQKLFLSNKNMPEDEYKRRIIQMMYIRNASVQYLVFLPIIIGLTVYAFVGCDMSWWEYMLGFLASIGFWTAFEYTTHRYVFHANPKRALMRKFLYSLHWGHHEYPNDDRIMLVSPLISLPTAIMLYLMSYFLVGVYVNPFMAGVMSIYLLYDWFHFASHNKNYNNWWFQLMKQHHLKHHYQDNAKNYGFTSPIWDKVLDSDIH